MKRAVSGKTIVAWICVLSLVMSYFANLEFTSSASAGEYTELTFSDFGFEDRDVSGASPMGTAGLTSWDKVAFTGKVKMPGTNTDDHYLRFGVQNGGAWTGISIRSASDALIVENAGFATTMTNSNGSTPGYMILGVGETITNQEITLRLTFDVVNTSDLKVTFTVNGTASDYVIFSGVQSTTYDLLVYAASGKTVSIASVEPEPEEPIEFNELTFSDFNLSDQNIKNANPEGSAGLTSWDKVALTGKVKMPGTGAEDHYFLFGSWGGITVRSYDKGIILTNGAYTGDMLENTNKDGKNWLYIDAGENIVNKEIKLRVEFEYVNADDLKVTVTINDTHSGYGIFDNREVKTSPSAVANYNLMVREFGGNTISIASVTTGEPEEPITYTEMTFDDFNLNNRSVTNGSIEAGAGLDSWDKIAVTGEVTMPGTGAEDHYFLFGSWGGYMVRSYDRGLILTANSYTGDMVENTNKDGNSWLYIDAGEDITNKKITMRVTFEHVNTEDIKVTITINGTHSGYGIFANREIKASSSAIANYNVLAFAVAGNTITIGTPQTEEPDPTEFDEYTFSDFGLKNQIVEQGTAVTNKQEAITGHWDAIAIEGTVQLPASDQSFLRLGTLENAWEGMEVRWAEGGHIALTNMGYGNTVLNSDGNANGWVVIGKDKLGYEETEDIAGKYLGIRVEFMQKNEGANVKVKLTVTGKDGKQISGWIQVENPSRSYFGIGIGGGGGAVNIASKGTTPVVPEKPVILEKPQKAISEYREITFSNFLIQNAIVKGEVRQGSVADLDGKVFKGKITFPAEGEGYIGIGGNAESEWYGLRIGLSDEGELVIFESVNGKQVWKISPEKMGKEIAGKQAELWLTFTEVNEHNVYVGVYVDGTFCGERLYKDLEQPFGSRLMVYSPEVGIKIVSVDTAWQRLLKSEVDFRYWGFTNNWRSELKAICN